MQSLRDDGYRVAPLRELVDAATAGLLDRRTVSLTFDDGYLDALTTVAPILQEFGFPGTFFIIGAALEGHHEFWWDALGRAFLSGRPLPERCVLRLASGVLDLPTRNREERQAAHDRIAEEFYRFGLGSRTSALGAIEAWAGSRSSPNDVRRPMSAEEVVQLAAAPGVSIGAHSQHHLRLPVLSRDEKQAEIASCKLRLENLLGRPVKAFSYPYGSCDIETMQLIREAGFDTAVTTEEGLVSMHTDRLRVPRIEVRCSGARAVADRLEDIWR
jgi:peptidoglycan/xylan/chitin deacetylase (PgdA/CDA1 family)